MLTDAGPLIAVLDKNDRNHDACVAVMRGLPGGPLWTTWPCLTEAMYLLHGIGGHPYQGRLWGLCRDRRLLIWDITAAEAGRMDALMAQYANVPMDFADASLVAIAESRGIRRLFTIDSDFYIYRLHDGSVLEIVR